MIAADKRKDIRQMFRAAFWYGGQTDLFAMERDPDAKKKGYTAATLKDILEEAIPQFWEPNRTFQQDNAPIHKARLLQDYLDEQGIRRLEWPPYSPDLNPIEHLWWELKKQVLRENPHLSEMGKSDEALDAFVLAAQTAWSHIRGDVMRSLIESMPRRLAAVRKARGWQTRY